MASRQRKPFPSLMFTQYFGIMRPNGKDLSGDPVQQGKEILDFLEKVPCQGSVMLSRIASSARVSNEFPPLIECPITYQQVTEAIEDVAVNC